jgi:tetratricopeptide (TPR) repeat protein
VTERHETGSTHQTVDVARLAGDVAWAIEKGLGPRDLVPMDPWRTASLARQVLVHQESDRTWALLGLALSVLGHYASAKRAFAKALHLAPGCPSYAHNLGHLLDVGLDRPREALRWLEQAFQIRPFDAEIAASYAHALVRLGRTPEARQALEGAMGEIPGAVDAMLARWA